MKTKHSVYLLVHVVIFLVGVLLTIQHHAIWQSIGTSLVATGVAGWMVFLYTFVSARAAEQLTAIQESGLKEMFSYRSVNIRAKYEERVKNARDGVDIIGFGLRSLREDFGDQFAEWATRADVRILLLDPEFPNKTTNIAAIRDREEQNPTNSIHSDVRAFISKVSPLMKANSRFKVRLYQTLPMINYFRIDDEIFWGPYLMHLQSRNTPTLLVGRSGKLFEQLSNHFQKIWTDDALSRSIPPDWM